MWYFVSDLHVDEEEEDQGHVPVTGGGGLGLEIDIIEEDQGGTIIIIDPYIEY